MSISSVSRNVMRTQLTQRFASNEAQHQFVTQLFRDTPAGRFHGYHGTRLTALDGQLQQRQFEDRNQPIYLSTEHTALKYALRRLWSEHDGYSMYCPTYRVSDDQGVILAISSDTRPLQNDLSLHPHLFAYYYFPPGAKVSIDGAWLIDQAVSPTQQLKENSPYSRTLNELAVVTNRSRVTNFILRTIFKIPCY